MHGAVVKKYVQKGFLMSNTNKSFRGKLSSLLLTEPRLFNIVVPNQDLPITIIGYSSINITFDSRIEYEMGLRRVMRLPLVEYKVRMAADQKLRLYNFFRDGDQAASLTVHTRPVRLALGEERYVFKAKVMAIPDCLTGDVRTQEFSTSGNRGIRPLHNGWDNYTISIKLDFREFNDFEMLTADNLLFTEIDEAVFNRSEILDI